MSANATLTNWQRLTNPYRKLLFAVGAATLVFCAYELPLARLDFGFILLSLQGISEIIKKIAVMRGLIPDPAPPQSVQEMVAHEAAVAAAGEAHEDREVRR